MSSTKGPWIIVKPAKIMSDYYFSTSFTLEIGLVFSVNLEQA
jgi:hypothetical protein